MSKIFVLPVQYFYDPPIDQSCEVDNRTLYLGFVSFKIGNDDIMVSPGECHLEMSVNIEIDHNDTADTIRSKAISGVRDAWNDSTSAVVFGWDSKGIL